MDFSEIVVKRRSVRKFRDDDVQADVLTGFLTLRAGLLQLEAVSCGVLL